LVMGSISSGTVQTTADLYEKLGIEVGHDVQDTSNYFTRDGTVSLFHGWRFLEPPTDETQQVEALKLMCQNGTTHRNNMGFHPQAFKANQDCNSRDLWSSCWARACMDVLIEEWGCELSQSCPTPFVSKLHQVRHPLRVVESLVVNFCQTNDNKSEELPLGTPHFRFLQYMQAWFPKRDWNSMSCVEPAATYVVDYNHLLLKASKKVPIQLYKVETTSPCQLAHISGLTDPTRIVYEPHLERLQELCSQDSLDIAMEPMTEKHIRNMGILTLDLDDLMGGKHGSKRSSSDKSLMKEMKVLIEELGY